MQRQYIELWRDGWNSNIYCNWDEIPDNVDDPVQWLKEDCFELADYVNLEEPWWWEHESWDGEVAELHRGRYYILEMPDDDSGYDRAIPHGWDEAIDNYAVKGIDFTVTYRKSEDKNDFNTHWHCEEL